MARNGAPDLCHLKAVCKSGAEQITFVIYKYLGLVFETTESGRVNDAVTITLIFTAPARRGLAKPAPAGRIRIGRVAGQFRHRQHLLRPVR